MSAGSWTHAICNECWCRDNPGKVAVRARIRCEACCYCGQATTGGIYVRDMPEVHLR